MRIDYSDKSSDDEPPRWVVLVNAAMMISKCQNKSVSLIPHYLIYDVAIFEKILLKATRITQDFGLFRAIGGFSHKQGEQENVRGTVHKSLPRLVDEICMVMGLVGTSHSKNAYEVS